MAEKTIRYGLLALTALGGFAASQSNASAAMSFCVDKSSPSHAMDERVAKAVAGSENMTTRLYQFDGSADGDDDGYDASNFKKLAAEKCSLVLGFPVDTSAKEPAIPEGTHASLPYARTGFVLVTPRGSEARALSDLPRGSEVAVTNLTAPNLYFEKHPNVRASVYPTDAEAMNDLVAHKVPAAMIWQASAVNFLAAKGQDRNYCIHALNEPHAQWNVVALYGASGAQAAQAFNAAVTTLRHSGKLASVVAPYAETPKSGFILAADETSSKPALFTEDQAKAGAKEYADNCSQCHGDDLSGMAGPALKGPNFASAKANFHVSDIYAIVSKNMPATNPGSLTTDQYVNIMAFLLQQNGMPAGSTKLTADIATKSQVPLIYSGK
ncbi:c-type cytochrome [Acidomonas methanolica]|uniref:Cytochrome c class I n=1 Tax=Acidomonas methanolica NBRC 104435 TaxID=1231351 RepID=A0A023D338_ACIMT|nr:c-type cytochrome [Acidomonas methanolica]MBU2654475.1 c-type cytochrome [Acidomonas methanolica]TCS28278.1 amino acid ABC transporter substrate-binding protein (PAAT family) [Acidomonas methanolica]GAJ28588.1 cytochrome c class I [Acidomonas methanolica NBRC 104435]GBQ49112.1 cytochrome c class I [Acidomonas methanolica]GEK98995.1 hypothetical protein AME01nite_14940 [Acidomonas methanolica NBRC 104435]